MHCPRCGQRQNSDEIRFCTKCGLEIGDVKDLLAPELRQTNLQRKSELNKARRQGMIMIFSSFALIIIFAGLQEFFPLPKIIALVLLLFMIGGAFRASMPSLFTGKNLAKSKVDLPEDSLEINKLKDEQFSDKSLPEAEYRPPINYSTKQFDTNELVAPLSVTENTTRNLEKEF